MRKRWSLFLFGEAEKGELCTPILCRSLPQLCDRFGQPPENSRGLEYAIQALLYDRELYFFRVEEEGFSIQDYLKGLQVLRKESFSSPIAAICMPGVGDAAILHASHPVCELHKSFLIVSEQDFYDYLTTRSS